MSSSRAITRPRNLFLVLCAAFLALVSVGFVGGSSAIADEVDTDKYDFYVAGNVKYDGEPLEGVQFLVQGEGVDAEVATSADGKWKVGVPEKGVPYTVTLVGETLPEGVIVEADEEDDSIKIDGNNAVKEVQIKQTSVIANFFLGQGERVTTSFIDQLLQRIVNGLNFGLLLALAAIGASLIFGTTGLTNFAHGEMVTFGALMAYAFSVLLAWPLWLAIIAAVALSAVLGFTLDTGLWKPLRRRGVGIVQVMIVSIGLSLALRYIFQFFVGGGTMQLPGAQDPKIQFGPVAVSAVDLYSMGISVVVLLFVAWWLLRTRIGKATRAISDNVSLASASGIDVDKVIRIVWIFAAALAGLAGILWAYFRPGLKWDMGSGILLLVFAAITLGGLGTAFGALVGAIVVGLLVEVSTLWIPSDLKFAGALVILILVLLVRPQGILGRKERIG